MWNAIYKCGVQEPSFANAMAMGPGYLYSLPSDVLKKHLKADSQLGTEV